MPSFADAISCWKMPHRPDIISVIAETARDWRDPEYERRAAAVKETLKASNTFTAEAVAFAVNQQVSLINEDALMDWAPARPSAVELRIGVLNAGNVPFVGMQDFLAVSLSGHRYIGSVSSRSPALLPSFVADVCSRTPLDADFVETEVLFNRAQAVIATGSDETAAWVTTQCEKSGIPTSRRLIRGHRYSVAIIDGAETENELESLAEDALLHEGFGCRNVSLVWAPDGHSPDALLEAFARFRAVFPAHARTPGRLKMQQAFLEAIDAPHAHGEGLEFLMSKGDPDVQAPGHVRWTEYDSIDEVRQWLLQHRSEIQLVVARRALHTRLAPELPIGTLGEAQRPALNWCPDERDVMTFLVELT